MTKSQIPNWQPRTDNCLYARTNPLAEFPSLHQGCEVARPDQRCRLSAARITEGCSPGAGRSLNPCPRLNPCLRYARLDISDSDIFVRACRRAAYSFQYAGTVDVRRPVGIGLGAKAISR